VVEHPPHHPKVEILSLADAAGAWREKNEQNGLPQRQVGVLKRIPGASVIKHFTAVIYKML
jgi:hypothetical protein